MNADVWTLACSSPTNMMQGLFFPSQGMYITVVSARWWFSPSGSHFLSQRPKTKQSPELQCRVLAIIIIIIIMIIMMMIIMNIIYIMLNLYWQNVHLKVLHIWNGKTKCKLKVTRHEKQQPGKQRGFRFQGFWRDLSPTERGFRGRQSSCETLIKLWVL